MSSSLYFSYRKVKEENAILRGLLENLPCNKSNLSGYVIKLDSTKINVVCDACHRCGEVCPNCKQCGGKGVHTRKKSVWVVDKNKVDIEKIDRSPDDQKLRFWTDDGYYTDITSANKYYPYDVAFLHFSLKDAYRECERLNALLEREVAK